MELGVGKLAVGRVLEIGAVEVTHLGGERLRVVGENPTHGVGDCGDKAACGAQDAGGIGKRGVEIANKGERAEGGEDNVEAVVGEGEGERVGLNKRYAARRSR